MKKLLLTFGFIVFFSANTLAFNDLDNTHKNNQAIKYLQEKQIIQGYEDGTFKPEKEINRAEMIKVLVEGNGIKPNADNFKNCFPDVKDEWFASYICYAKFRKWIGGYPDGTFKPAQTVSKVESLKMMLNAFEIPLSNTAGASFSDVNAEDWFAPYVRTAREKGLLEEVSVRFNPANPQSRAKVSENLFRTIIIKEKKADKFSPELLGEIKEIVKEGVEKIKQEENSSNYKIYKTKQNKTTPIQEKTYQQEINEFLLEYNKRLKELADKFRAAKKQYLEELTAETTGFATSSTLKARKNKIIRDYQKQLDILSLENIRLEEWDVMTVSEIKKKYNIIEQ
ncbi:MAG: S-layer homology domain-containing protein [Candidatus Saelkia tenebricola]|nr:S-layer homology domain-containing protein [Candidatus Saelkia tenebricola]